MDGRRLCEDWDQVEDSRLATAVMRVAFGAAALLFVMWATVR